jgi:hypothetical protein
METFLRSAAHCSGGVLWSRHAIERLVLHRLSRAEVEASLATCSIIETYPEVISRCPLSS